MRENLKISLLFCWTTQFSNDIPALVRDVDEQRPAGRSLPGICAPQVRRILINAALLYRKQHDHDFTVPIPDPRACTLMLKKRRGSGGETPPPPGTYDAHRPFLADGITPFLAVTVYGKSIEWSAGGFSPV